MRDKRKSMLNFLITGMLMMVLTTAWSQNQKLIIGNNSGTSYNATVVSDKSDLITLKFNLYELNLNEVKTEYGLAYTVSSPKAPNFLIKGSPDLIYLTGSLIIPETGSMEIEVIAGDYEEYKDIEIAPSKGNLTRDVYPNQIPFEKGLVYKKNEFFPNQLASLRDPYVLRDYRGQTVEIYPVQYNPVTKTLRVYSEITVVLKHTNDRGINEFVDQRANKAIYAEFDNIYRRNFLNYSHRAKYQPIEDNGLLLVVAYPAFMDAIKPYVNWKKQKGQEVKLVSYTEAGGTSANLKNYITNQYNSDEGLCFVLLVGDGPQIPPLYKGGDSDAAYGHIVGTDSYAEAFIGRFSAENVAQVQTQVDKTITYERDLTADDTWLTTGMGIASSEGGGGQGDNGESDIQHMNIIRNKLLNYTYSTVYQVYDPGAQASTVVANLNTGTSIINYTGHGATTYWVTTNFGVNHMGSLTNVNKLPFIFDVACVNGDFKNNTCFAEGFMRANTANGPTGSIAIIASTVNQSWAPPMRGQDEMNDILVESYQNNIKRTYGGIAVNGCMNMNDVYGSSGYSETNTWTIFGDPSLMVRTAVPGEMIVTHNPTIFLGSSSFMVNCDTDGALVAISFNNDEDDVVVLGKAVVESGLATVTFEEPITTPADLVVTVTAYNKATYIGQVAAVPADEPYVILKSYVTSDSPNFGETVGINVVLENISEDPFTASDVTATISSGSEFVNIVGNTVNAGTIEPGQVVTLDEAYTIEIADSVPDQTPIVFTITISGEYEEEVYEWSQNFIIKANAPVLSIGGLTIDDGGEGVPNYLEPGESAQVQLTVTNTGHAAAGGVTARLFAATPFLSILNGEVAVDVAAEGTAEVSFGVEANGSTPDGLAVELGYSAELGVYAAEGSTTITIGPVPEATIGQGTSDTQSYYPFDNYWKANKSQMLYLASEVSLAPQTIKELGFYFKSVGATNPYVNVAIRLMETDLTAMPSSYVPTTGATTVFSASSYTMPSQPGWHLFDIDDFEYSGQHNLLVEVTFGINADWSSTRYRVNCTPTSASSVTYGYSDTQPIPNYSGVTTLRPNLYLAFDAILADQYPVSIVVEDVSHAPIPDAEVVIGSLPLVTDDQGEQSLELPSGAYPWSASKEGYVTQTGLLEVSDESTTLTIVLRQVIGEEAEILTFDFEEDVVEYVTISPVEDNAGSILVAVTAGTDVTSLTPTITVSYGATIAPMGGITMDFSEPVTFVVTSEDELTVNTYTVTVKELFPVTFNVNMTYAESFDPAVDTVFLTGNMLGWAVPGSEPELQTMERVEGTMVWRLTHLLLAGDYEYKYFLNSGWDGGEWQGGENRGVSVSGPTEVNDNWGWPSGVPGGELTGVSVYPNPFSGYLTVSGASGVSRVVITNLLGQVVLDRIVSGTELTVSTGSLSGGIYVVTLVSPSGERVTRKMVKQ
ncbi:MAG TPA: C25 family cysteine peptidase [Tenuifilaceae bacterium]|nr:C25 family cysteine peptidase [Tenuifilaceae bacterium]HOM85964.1 C25 family cysteine peptidase [Tenuifilaceae bacterium]HOQ35557.1 C25 family cysteine peptidase [Tenuifilaceae bacterium]HOU63898.1 C25 family cysteine peptidase [Tenuifilaceae bacterium]HPC69683.1 C25 family cysteine peptidase [Tenuifilaceae bacterium]